MLEEWVFSPLSNLYFSKENVLNGIRYERVKNKEEMNLFERELRSQAEMTKQIRFNDEVEDIELVESDVSISKLPLK